MWQKWSETGLSFFLFCARWSSGQSILKYAKRLANTFLTATSISWQFCLLKQPCCLGQIGILLYLIFLSPSFPPFHFLSQSASPHFAFSSKLEQMWRKMSHTSIYINLDRSHGWLIAHPADHLLQDGSTKMTTTTAESTNLSSIYLWILFPANTHRQPWRGVGAAQIDRCNRGMEFVKFMSGKQRKPRKHGCIVKLRRHFETVRLQILEKVIPVPTKAMLCPSFTCTSRLYQRSNTCCLIQVFIRSPPNLIDQLLKVSDGVNRSTLSHGSAAWGVAASGSSELSTQH